MLSSRAPASNLLGPNFVGDLSDQVLLADVFRRLAERPDCDYELAECLGRRDHQSLLATGQSTMR